MRMSKADRPESKLNTFIRRIKAAAALALALTVVCASLPFNAAANAIEAEEACYVITAAAGELMEFTFADNGGGAVHGEPVFAEASVGSTLGKEALGSYIFLSWGGYESFSVGLTESVELRAGESLAIYPIYGYELADEPAAEDIQLTGGAEILTEGTQGIALVREYDAAGVEYRESEPLKTGDGAWISLSGYLPEDFSFEAEAVGYEDTDIICAYDITIYDGGGDEFQPCPGFPIEVRIESGKINKALMNCDEPAVQHVGGGGLEEVKAASADGAVVFEAESFSTYIIRKHEGDEPLVTPRRFYHFLSPVYEEVEAGVYRSESYVFQNDANDDTSVQIIKSGDALEKVPIPPNKTDEYFYGWYIVDVQRVEGDIVTYKWEDDPSRVVFDVAMTFTDDCDSDIYLAPMYSNYRFITFHENEADQPNGPNVLTRKLIALGDNNELAILISDVRAQPPDAQRIIFWGWDHNGEQKQTVRNDGTEISTTCTITDVEVDVHLYPVFKQARWLTFDTGGSGSGAKYVPARFVVQGDSVTELPVSSRVGYSFGGWYSDEDGGVRVTDSDGAIVSGGYDLGEGNVISGGQLTLEENQKLYARWIETATASYTVIYWKQKSDDPKNAADSEKKYDYDMSETRSGNTGSAITGSFNNKSYTGFSYRATTVSNGGVIKSDGSTVVNVYYDRDLMVINFYYKNGETPPSGAVSSYIYTATTSTLWS